MWDVIPGLEVITAPTVLAVDYATDLAPHCRLLDAYDAATHQAFVEGLAWSAIHKVEHDTQRNLITCTLKQTLKCLPYSRDNILLLRGPVQVEDLEFKYLDTDGEEQELEIGTDFQLDRSRFPNQLYLKFGKTWPRVLDEENAAWITHKAGFGDAFGDVPKPYRQLASMLVAGWLENPEAVTSLQLKDLPNPIGYDALIDTVMTRGF